MKRIGMVVLIFAISLPTLSFSAWKTSTKVDQMTDEKTVFAEAVNQDAMFFVYQEGDKALIGGLVMLRPLKQIYYDPKEVVVRVDNNPAHSLSMRSWEPKRAYFELPIILVDEIVAGKTVKIQYPTSANGRAVVAFSLAGSTKAIASAFPSYENKDARMARFEKEVIASEEERKQLEDRMAKIKVEKEAYYEANCPDEWHEIQAVERQTGRPQLFRGCPKDQ